MSAAGPALKGIFVPNVVPLDRKGNVNETELRRYIDWLIAQGVHGLYPNGSTGEFLRFTVEERRDILRIIVEQTAGRVPILAGAAEANTRETIRACELYHKAGARAVAIVSPFYYRVSADGVYAYFAEIAKNSPIDVTLYNIPMFASPIDVPTIRRLADEFPRVIGIKDSSGDLTHMLRMIAAVRPLRPDFSFLTGWDATLMAMLLIGCDGGTHASAGVVPELTGRIYDLCKNTAASPKVLDEARQRQNQLLALFDVMIAAQEFPAGFRLGVELRGFEPGPIKHPLTKQQKKELDKIRPRLQELLDSLDLIRQPSARR